MNDTPKSVSVELMGVGEAASELGITRQRLFQLNATKPKGFPVPIAHLSCGPIWTARAIRQFGQQWDRKPGRPKSGDDGALICWCGGQVGPIAPGDDQGLGCLDDIHHDWNGHG